MAPSLGAVLLAQHLAGLPVDEMHLGAGLADDRPILVGRRIFVVFEPVLDLELCRRTSEHKVGHPVVVDGIERTALI
jgi:hypothetical protein